ncbi:hypothetical protein [Aureimonas sp. ME7]|uniref:hypothetical protein n=1 Tax=Aureimonas sp. ME7 TaxID=2744252 RepID=UPI0015F70039|nr:hypothetical protein [Aureimonas sp. ME7]
MVAQWNSEGSTALDWRPVASVAVLVLVLLLGSTLPLPGLDPVALQNYLQASPDGSGRVSVLALGLGPLLSVLLVFETLKLFSPAFSRRIARSPGSRAKTALAIRGAMLLVAALQGLGIHAALAEMGFVENDPLAKLAVVASLVAGVGVLAFAAEQVRLPLLADAGFWAIISLPWVESIVATFLELMEYARIGAIGPEAVVVAAACLAAAVASIVFATTSLRKRVREAGGSMLRWSPILVWPPLLAGAVANILAGLAYEFAVTRIEPTVALYSVLWTILFALILPVVVFLYARSIAKTFEEPDWPGRRATLALLALTQIGVCAGLLMASDQFAVALNGSALITLVVFLWALGQAVFANRDAGRTGL